MNCGCYAHSLTESLWKVLSTSSTVCTGKLTFVMKTNKKINTSSSTSAQFSPNPFVRLKFLSPVSHKARDAEQNHTEMPPYAS